MEALSCPSCGAPLPPSTETSVVCRYCAHLITGVPALPWGSPLLAEPWAGRPEDGGRQRAVVMGRPYVVLGRLGIGEGCEVFLGRRDTRLPELVVLKVLRAAADADLLAREWRTLGALSGSRVRGAPYFAGLLPQRVTSGRLVTAGRPPGRASVFRWRSGFHHSFEDIARAYPSGVDPAASVWLWKRALELLGWVHASGYAHGAVLPAHLLVHPRDHGVVLVGWSAAAALDSGARLAAASVRGRDYYPAALWAGAPPSPATDLIMLARCVSRLLGGRPDGAAPAAPGPLAALLRRQSDPHASGRVDDAWALIEALTEVSERVFGPPRYVPFHMPPKER